MLRSGETAYRKTLTAEATNMEKEETDPEGAFALALEARRITTEGYVSRAFIIGCGATMTDEQIYAMTDSQQLVIRVAEFLLDTEASDLDILARQAVRTTLGIGSIGPGAVLVAALPAGVVLAALLVLIRRRNR